MPLRIIKKDPSYRWVILSISLALMIVVNGMTFGGPTVFDDIILNTLTTADGQSISRGELKLRETIMIWSAACFGFLTGIFADKYGVKPIIMIGLVGLSFATYSYSKINSLSDIYIIYLIFGPTLIFVGSLVNVILISRWFSKNRALGLGIMAAGSSIGSGVLTPVYAWMLNFMEWRTILMWNSIIPLFMLIIVGFLLHEMPQRKKSIPSDNRSNKKTLDEFTFMEAIKNKNLWFIILMAMCLFYAIMGITTNAFLFLKDSGFNTQVASISATLLFLGSLIGKISCGFFAEDFGRKKVLLCYFVFLIIGASLLTLSVSNNNSYFIWFGLGTFGLGFGGIYTLKQLLSADLFGLKSLGKITGIINLTDTIGAGLGPVMTGFFFDRTGSYQFSFLIILIVVLFSMIFASFLKINDNEIEQRKLSQIQ